MRQSRKARRDKELPRLTLAKSKAYERHFWHGGYDKAVKAGRSVAFSTLADLIASLAKAERDGSLRERLRYLCRAALLVVDEIGYLPVIPGGGNLFFQLVNARYEKGAMILTSNRGFAEWVLIGVE